ncbi:MAG: caspase family protein [Ferruginibacter sp.]
MTLDHSHTKVILIGNSAYPYWPKGDIKNIEVNLDKLKEIFCNADLMGIKNPGNIYELHNNSKLEIQLKVKDITKNCTPEDTLIIYYAGHGLLDIENLKTLYLATNDTRIDDKKLTCIPSEDLKEPLIKCKAGNKIMILDCCYATKAAGLQSDAASLGASYWGNTEGVYFIMSSDADEPSRFDPDNNTIPTFFTQKLIQTISEGTNVSQEIRTLDDVFNSMKQKWDKKIAPEPSNLSFKEIGHMPFCYNRYKLESIISVQSPDDTIWSEIEKNPNYDDLTRYITAYPEFRKRALNLWSKMKRDFEDLNKVLAKQSFDDLNNFIQERNLVAPALKAALANLKTISLESRSPLQNKPERRTRAGSKDKIGNAASSAVSQGANKPQLI